MINYISMNNNKGIFLISFALIFILMILVYVSLNVDIYKYSNSVRSDYITSSNILTDQVSFENNINFIIKEMMDLSYENSSKKIKTSVYIANIATELGKYLVLEGFDVPSNLQDSMLLHFDIVNSTIYYSVTIDANISKKYTENGLLSEIKIPRGYVVNGALK